MFVCPFVIAPVVTAFIDRARCLIVLVALISLIACNDHTNFALVHLQGEFFGSGFTMSAAAPPPPPPPKRNTNFTMSSGSPKKKKAPNQVKIVMLRNWMVIFYLVKPNGQPSYLHDVKEDLKLPDGESQLKKLGFLGFSHLRDLESGVSDKARNDAVGYPIAVVLADIGPENAADSKATVQSMLPRATEWANTIANVS